MRYIIALILMFSFITKSSSQTYEIGPTIGGVNFIGDIGNTAYINPSTLGFGAVFKWNRSVRHAFRFSLLYAKIEANDIEAESLRRKERGFQFENSALEASAGIEYTFWEYDLHSGKPQFTPYLYTGITYFKSNHLLWTNEEFSKTRNNWSFAIPMVVGIKKTITRKLIAGLEIGARYTFTDNIDGSSPAEIGYYSSTSFGNQNTNDWYVYTGLTITYSFGRKPCFCSF